MLEPDDQLRMKINFNQPKVLIIEDNDDHYVLIQKVLQYCLPQIDLTRMSSADQTLALLEQWQFQEWELPKLILLDLYLPTSSDGWYLLEQIKRMPSPTSLIPIVMLSASNLQADITKAYQLGVSAYMVKPSDYPSWITQFQSFCTYWWGTGTFPPLHYNV